MAKDITEQMEASESLRDSEQRYRMLAESISDVIFSTDSKLSLNYVSPSVQAVLGYERRVDFAERLAIDHRQSSATERLYTADGSGQQGAGQTRATGESCAARCRLSYSCSTACAPMAARFPMELRLVLVWDEHGAFEGVLGVGRDISQQRRAEKDLRMAATVFEHSTSAILITDPAGLHRPGQRSL